MRGTDRTPLSSAPSTHLDGREVQGRVPAVVGGTHVRPRRQQLAYDRSPARVRRHMQRRVAAVGIEVERRASGQLHARSASSHPSGRW
jgi:hypothetical protein